MAGTRVALLSEAFRDDRMLPRYELTEWRQRYGIVAGVTAATHGFDLDLWRPDSDGMVKQRWATVQNAFRSQFSGIAISRQVHGKQIGIHTGQLDGLRLLHPLDGHSTAIPGTLLAVTVADCIPIYLLHPESNSVALLHAGWRGVVAGILEAGISALGDLTGASAREIVIHCGIGICGDCYEVGTEVIEALGGEPAADSAKLDLRSVLVQRAHDLGIYRSTQSTWCSAHDGDRFYSHRESRGREGRMIAYLGKPLT